MAAARAVQPDPEPDPLAPTVRSSPKTGRPDAGDRSAAGLYSLNLKTAGRLAGLRLRNRYLTDLTISNRKIAHFLSYLLRSDLNSKENRPFSIGFVEIWPELKELGEISSRFGLISSRYTEISSRSSQISSRSA